MKTDVLFVYGIALNSSYNEKYFRQTLEIKSKHILCSKTFFFRNSFHLWDNVGKHGRARQATDDDIIRRWRFACWVTKATNTHSIHVTIVGFPRRKWLGERASILRYTCIVYWLWKHSFFNISGPSYRGFSTFLVQRTCYEDSRILQTPSPNYLNFQLA